MNIKIIVAGKPALPYAKSGIEDYLKRLTRYGQYELIVIKSGTSDDVSERLLERSHGCFRIALDERGQAPTTRQFFEKMESLEMRGDIKSVAFLIGASDGHNAALRQQSDMILQLSSLTLQHEFALLLLAEQLYRIATIKSGAPYHRD